MRLNRDFQELLECFARRGVRYLVVGGWALAAHGIPRLTKDLDVWVWPDPGNAERVTEALDDFGFSDVGLVPRDFLAEDVVIQLGYPPNRVDLLTTPTGVDFDSCWSERLDVPLDGLVVPFIGLEGLKANKRATGRPQDLVDLAALESAPRD
ncbi:MAG: hypothetical protein ACR2KE_10325 [Candidatus Nanopelagicales bacterium]